MAGRQRNFIAVSVTAVLLSGTLMPQTVRAEEALQVYQLGEQVILTIDGISGEYIGSNTTGDVNISSSDGTVGADGTTNTTAGDFLSDNGLLQQPGMAQRQAVWGDFEQIITDLENNGTQTSIDMSPDQTNVLIEGTIKRPDAQKINSSVEQYKTETANLNPRIIAQPSLTDMKDVIKEGQDDMAKYLNDLYQQIADAYNDWSVDPLSVPEIQPTESGFEYTARDFFGQPDREVVIPFTSTRFYPVSFSYVVPVLEETDKPVYQPDSSYPKDIPLVDEYGHKRLFCDYEIQKSDTGIYYIYDDEGDIYCLSMDDFNNTTHCYFDGESHPLLLSYNVSDGNNDVGLVIQEIAMDLEDASWTVVNQKESWHYVKRVKKTGMSGSDDDSDQALTLAFKDVSASTIGISSDLQFRNIVIPGNSGLVPGSGALPGVDGLTLDNPPLVFDPNSIIPDGLTPEDIQLENAAVLAELYRLMEEAMVRDKGITLDPDIQTQYDSIDDWMDQHSNDIENKIANMSPEAARKYLQDNLGLNLEDAQELMRKTFEENKKRFKLPDDTSAVPDEWADRFQNFDRYASSSMEDVCDVILIEQFLLDSVRYVDIDVKKFTSDMRRWHIYNQGGGEEAIVITNNPEHALGITPLTAGTYSVTADQWVEQAQSADVQYTVIKKLIEKSTGRVLYQVTKQGQTNNGAAMFKLGAEGNGHWEATGEWHTYRVNDMGQIVSDDHQSDVHRVR